MNIIPQQAEIVLEKNNNQRNQPDFNDFDAVLNCVSRMDSISKLIYQDFVYSINSNDSIEVAKGIKFELLPPDESKPGAKEKKAYKLFSDDLGIKEIKQYIRTCRADFDSQRNDKLGNEQCFFDQVTTKDTSELPALIFDKKKFETNRTFANISFGKKKAVESRVKHFMENKEWYSRRGIPYTLGFLFHGVPGCGKSSTIKAIANVTGRHIINVKFSDIKTNTQLKNLFYNPVLNVVNSENMQTEKFNVPIHQRLYVIEDIDCMTDLIKRRDIDDDDDDDDKKEKNDNKKDKKEKNDNKKDNKQKNKKDTLSDIDLPDNDTDTECEMIKQHLRNDMKNDFKNDIMKDDEAEGEISDKITLDSLLNIFDGTLEIPSRMFCITTNRLEIIDEALIRPGRVDMIVEYTRASIDDIKEMFENFYEKQFTINQFEKIKSEKISHAVVNQVLFKHFDIPESAMEELTTIANKRKSYNKK